MFTHCTLSLNQGPNLRSIARSFLDSEATKKKKAITYCDAPDDVQYNERCWYTTYTSVPYNECDPEAYGAKVRNFAGSAVDCAAACHKYTGTGFYYSCESVSGSFSAECRW